MLTESYTVRAPSRTGSILASQSGGDLILVGGGGQGLEGEAVVRVNIDPCRVLSVRCDWYKSE